MCLLLKVLKDKFVKEDDRVALSKAEEKFESGIWMWLSRQFVVYYESM